jgi:hypothetical protein
MDEGDDHNLRVVNVSKTTATALWFSSFEILKQFRQILAAELRNRKFLSEDEHFNFVIKPNVNQ